MIVACVLLWSVVSLWVPVLVLDDAGTIALVSSAAWLLGLTLLAVWFGDEVSG